jgi:hypothetical protein
MAEIKSLYLEQNVWTEVTDASCTLQNRSNGDVLVSTSTSTPDNTDDAFVVQPKKTTQYVSDEDKLYAYRSFDGTCLLAYSS